MANCFHVFAIRAYKVGICQCFVYDLLLDFYMFSLLSVHPFFYRCSKRLRGLRPFWSQRTARHHHQTGSRASNFHWLVPGLGSQDVGDGSVGQNPCPFLNTTPPPRLFLLDLTPQLSSASYCHVVYLNSNPQVPKPTLSLLSG